MANAVGRAALFYGAGRPFELKEYPVPDPEPGAVVMRITLANVCGSDLHQWRGEMDLKALGRPLPQILGHEMTGTVHQLGEGVTRDTAGVPLNVGDRVLLLRCKGGAAANADDERRNHEPVTPCQRADRRGRGGERHNVLLRATAIRAAGTDRRISRRCAGDYVIGRLRTRAVAQAVPRTRT